MSAGKFTVFLKPTEIKSFLCYADVLLQVISGSREEQTGAGSQSSPAIISPPLPSPTEQGIERIYLTGYYISSYSVLFISAY